MHRSGLKLALVCNYSPSKIQKEVMVIFFSLDDENSSSCHLLPTYTKKPQK